MEEVFKYIVANKHSISSITKKLCAVIYCILKITIVKSPLK